MGGRLRRGRTFALLALHALRRAVGWRWVLFVLTARDLLGQTFNMFATGRPQGFADAIPSSGHAVSPVSGIRLPGRPNMRDSGVIRYGFCSFREFLPCLPGDLVCESIALWVRWIALAHLSIS